jgi:UDP-N-acetylglucosamine 2-epimerase (non-hydrolysing)
MKKLHKILFVFGTRPEAIKMAPVVKQFAQFDTDFEAVSVVTAQHRDMLDQVLELFAIKPKYDLNIMTTDQTLSQISARALKGLDAIFSKELPDLIFVQGDTTTTFIAALTAFYHRVLIAHVEAGLRTHERHNPYPEEINRVLTSSITDLHFAPTNGAMRNLIKENISPDNIFVTGNTVIDALLDVASRTFRFQGSLHNFFSNPLTKKILLTTHRRENHGSPMSNICKSVLQIVNEFSDVEVLFPVHKSPKVRATVYPLLSGKLRIHLCDPLDYETFINAMKESYIILTDSGGIQEEAPSLGKPVLVLRETTERPEAVEAGTVKVVGLAQCRIYKEVKRLLLDQKEYSRMSRAINPYGDGLAAERILMTVRDKLPLYTNGRNLETVLSPRISDLQGPLSALQHNKPAPA